MKAKEQVVIKGNVIIPNETATLVGYRHYEVLIAGAKVTGNFNCSHTSISSLEQGPSWVGSHFDCSVTNITSLEGGPSYVGGHFGCWNTKIKSLYNIHKEIKHIGHMFFLSNTIESHILGVMFIKGLQKVEFYNGNTEQKQVENIINKHLGSDRNIHDAQEELIEAGLAEFAKL